MKDCISGFMEASLAKEENYTLVILGENLEKHAADLNVLVQLDLSLTHVHAYTLIQNRMAWECFLQPLWLPMVTSEMVFINYVELLLY